MEAKKETHLKSHESSIRCVTCRRPVPKDGEHPRYFGQSSIGYRAEHEAERAAEDLICCLNYTNNVTSAMWAFLQIAEKSPEIEKSGELDSARSLGFLLFDLIGEVRRRAEVFVDLVREKVDAET